MTLVEGPTLAELAETANRKLECVTEHARAALGHALDLGETLLTAQSKVLEQGGVWRQWVEANFHASYNTAELYMRLYHRRDQIPANVTTIGVAMKVITGGPSLNGVPTRYPDELREEALELGKRMTNREVAEVLGISEYTVASWKNPEIRKRHKAKRRQAAEQKRRLELALRQQERDRAVREVKGPVKDAYSWTRKAAQRVDQAHAEAEGREARLALKAALTKLHAAEDDIVRALGLS